MISLVIGNTLMVDSLGVYFFSVGSMVGTSFDPH